LCAWRRSCQHVVDATRHRIAGRLRGRPARESGACGGAPPGGNLRRLRTRFPAVTNPVGTDGTNRVGSMCDFFLETDSSPKASESTGQGSGCAPLVGTPRCWRAFWLWTSTHRHGLRRRNVDSLIFRMLTLFVVLAPLPYDLPAASACSVLKVTPGHAPSTGLGTNGLGQQPDRCACGRSPAPGVHSRVGRKRRSACLTLR
jgi:hypothetical protein